jgi:hypothetical protein
VGEQRRPGRVPDDGGLGTDPVEVTAGFDTDGDGRGDTTVGADGADLLLHTDLDGDGLADRLLRIGPDGTVRLVGPEPADGPGAGVVGGLLGGARAGSET